MGGSSSLRGLFGMGCVGHAGSEAQKGVAHCEVLGFRCGVGGLAATRALIRTGNTTGRDWRCAVTFSGAERKESRVGEGGAGIGRGCRVLCADGSCWVSLLAGCRSVRTLKHVEA